MFILHLHYTNMVQLSLKSSTSSEQTDGSADLDLDTRGLFQYKDAVL